MAELLAYLARELVDDPEAVRVEEEERDGALVLVLHVAPDDVGETFYRFDNPGRYEFACHLPGHYAYGMHGWVVVASR